MALFGFSELYQCGISVGVLTMCWRSRIAHALYAERHGFYDRVSICFVGIFFTPSVSALCVPCLCLCVWASDYRVATMYIGLMLFVGTWMGLVGSFGGD